jgi:hypothetical protein
MLPGEHTHILPSVEPLSYAPGGQGAKSAADCLYSSDFYPSVLCRLRGRALPGPLGTKDLTRVPRIQMCCSTEGAEAPS